MADKPQTHRPASYDDIRWNILPAPGDTWPTVDDLADVAAWQATDRAAAVVTVPATPGQVATLQQFMQAVGLPLPDTVPPRIRKLAEGTTARVYASYTSTATATGSARWAATRQVTAQLHRLARWLQAVRDIDSGPGDSNANARG